MAELRVSIPVPSAVLTCLYKILNKKMADLIEPLSIVENSFLNKGFLHSERIKKKLRIYHCKSFLVFSIPDNKLDTIFGFFDSKTDSSLDSFVSGLESVCSKF
jgi:hypothetical protein